MSDDLQNLQADKDFGGLVIGKPYKPFSNSPSLRKHWLVIVFTEEREILAYWEKHNMTRMEVIYQSNQAVQEMYPNYKFIVEPLARKVVDDTP